MKLIRTNLADVKLIEPKVFSDDRGYFLETYQKKRLKDLCGIDAEFVQDNHSFSTKGVLRGLHYQFKNPQGKLVQVITGEVFDVAVDLRKSSSTFGKWTGFNLSQENKRIAWIPPGFAHGFIVLSESANFIYKCTDYYSPGDEYSLLWNDATIGIKWPEGITPLISEKDSQGTSFEKALYFD